MFQVELDTREFNAFLRNFEKQLKYGTMLALNDLALRFQRVQRAHQRKEFTYSGSSGERYWHQGVKIARGDFAQRKKLWSRVSWVPKSRKGGAPKYQIFLRQQHGGTRRPIRGRKHLAIPDEDIPRTGGGQIQERYKPKRLKRSFKVPFGRGIFGVFQRHYRGSRQYVTAYSHRALGGGKRLSLRQDPNVEFRYLLIPKGQVQGVYDFYENATRVFDSHARRVVREKILYAFRTAK
jgi:hypothetical protein